MPQRGTLTNDFLAVAKQIEADIQTLLDSHETQDAFKEMVSKSAERNVYGAYTPTQYVRRGADGMGIADPWNYEVYSEKLKLRLVNNT